MMRRLKWKWLLSGIAIISLGAFIAIPEPKGLQVVGMPPSPYLNGWTYQPIAEPLPRLSAPASFSYPIKVGETGPVQPLLTAPLQYPFLCETEKSGLGQPLVDNQNGYGIPIYEETSLGDKTDKVIGYSKDCGLTTRVDYYYKPFGAERFQPWTPAKRDVQPIVLQGRQIPFIVRLERGTLNRFIYAIAVLKGPDDKPDKPDTRYWNRRLIYQFKGGVGIGRRQGKLSPDGFLGGKAKQLALGYAVITSTGNYTRNHYNIRLSEDTALRVKRQFMARYGEPLYTVGVGGSGGGLQQYLIGQNVPGLLDAAVPQYSYPDMVTQTVYAMDCELMEYYFDITAVDNPKWQDWSFRRYIEGLNARSGSDNKYRYLYWLNQLVHGVFPRLPEGSSECVRGWRGLTSLVYNPRFAPIMFDFDDHVRKQVNWTYWDDLKAVYGWDEQGYARTTWDNVGVQYGLEALRNGKISPEEFLDLNARIGGWKKPPEMKPEHLWLPFGKQLPLWFSMWGSQNMNLSPDDGKTPAPRTEGDIEAMRAAYRSGQVFTGEIHIPIIDLRHYLEPELNMHHSHASLAARIRMQKAMGHAHNQVIWSAHRPYDPTPKAFAVIDRWMENLRDHPSRSVIENKPQEAMDTCFDDQGRIIAQGNHVWDGDWNGKAPGACTRVYPYYGTSRTVAGGNLAGNSFKCYLQPVDQAIVNNLYGNIDMKPYAARLKEIFPEGVCDYTRGDAGRPQDVRVADLPRRQP